MIKLSNSKLLDILTTLLILALFAKIISLALMAILPSDGISLNQKHSYQPKFQRVDFKNMIGAKAEEVTIGQHMTSTASGINITNMVLKGLYGNQKSGFAIVALKSTPNKTNIISISESFSGYTLKSILSTGAVFVRNGVNYTLNLESTKAVRSAVSKADEIFESVDDEPISEQKVTRDDISYYAKNPKQIWKEISIIEVKKGKEIEGFKVTRIDPKSKFASMGLKKGDLIIKANNKELKSYKDALDIYAKIDQIDVVQIVIIRDGIEKEIVYEIN